MSDLIQDTRLAVVSILDSDSAVQAITGRTSANVVAWNPDAIVELPILAYQFIAAPELAADGDTREVQFQFSASAVTESQAHALLGAVEMALTQTAFLILASPLDAFVTRRVRRGFDLDVTLRVSRPTPVPA